MRFTFITLISVICVVGNLGCAKKLQASNLDKLQLGRTDQVMLRDAFGKPDSVDSYSDATGTSQILCFRHQGGTGFLLWYALDMRLLIAELQNNQLEGYIFAGTRGDNATKVDASAAAKLRPGASTRDEVASLMGPPVGKANRGTRMPDFKDLFTPGVSEVWAWTNVEGASGIIFQGQKYHAFFAKFDSSGRLLGTAHDDVSVNPFSGRTTRDRNTLK